MAKGCSGTVSIRITRKGEPEPVYNAAVVVSGEGTTLTLLTDADGRAEFDFPAPAVALSLKPGSGARPYSLCDLTVSLPASGEIRIKGCQVFPFITSYIQFAVPEDKGSYEAVIPPHVLTRAETRNRQNVGLDACLEEVPEFVTVHCGKPEEKAPDITVGFSDFIANVASSMLYPTWPESALRAEMLSLMTLARCIIASGVHRSKGYDIAAEPDGSMHYVPERMIFEPFKRLSAELSPFCIKGGDRSKLFNFSYWESLALASKGKTELEIIKSRFGNSAQIAECRKAVNTFSKKAIDDFTPAKIMEIQKCLNHISVCYLSIPMIVHPDGILGSATRTALKAYRKQFGLPEAEGLDKDVVRSIEYVCSILRKYAGNCGCVKKKNKVLVEGDANSDVVKLQYYLNGLSRRYGKRCIPPVAITGIFDDQTRIGLTAFQRFKKLPQSGVADHATWDLLEQECCLFADRVCEIKAYPGTHLTVGSEGENVAFIQEALNAFLIKLCTKPLPVNGRFDERTLNAVKDFQRLVGLEPTGIVDESTWKALSEEFISVGFTAEG